MVSGGISGGIWGIWEGWGGVARSGWQTLSYRDVPGHRKTEGDQHVRESEGWKSCNTG